MMTITDIAFLLFLSFGAASISHFFDDCMAEGMIFEKYGNWVRKLGKIGKPIGGCVKCTNFWIASVLFLIVFLDDITGHYFIAYALYIGISNTFVTLISKFYG